MLPFGVTIPATVPQGSEIPEGLMNNPVCLNTEKNGDSLLENSVRTLTNCRQQGDGANGVNTWLL